MIENAVIDQATEELRSAGLEVSRCDVEKNAILLIDRYPLPPGWNKSETQLLLMLPPSYPNGKPDMFWTDDDLTLASGDEPEKATTFENHCEKRWRRFSWHATKWTPGKDNIHTYMAFVDRRLAQLK